MKKLFKGKGIFFSRGYKAEGLNFVEKKSIAEIVYRRSLVYTLLVNSCDRPT